MPPILPSLSHFEIWFYEKSNIHTAQLLTEIKDVSVLEYALEGISCTHTIPFSERDGKTKEGRSLDLLGGGSVLPRGVCNYPTPGPHSWLLDMI